MERRGVTTRSRGGDLRLGLVDDHPLFRMAVSQVLRAEPGLTLLWDVASVPDAMGMLEEAPVDLVLMDVQLGGGIDGLEGTRLILRQRPQTLVILISALWQERVVRQGLRAGAAGFLSKGIRPSELTSTILALVKTHDPGRSAARVNRELAPPPQQSTLTRRQSDVLQLIRFGRTNREIAGLLGISSATVNKHVQGILIKLNARNRAQAVTLSERRGTSP